MFDEKTDLRIPGPTPVPPRILRHMARPLINHRGAVFHAIFPAVRERLKYVFQTDSDVLILTGSGTAGMEAAVANVVSPGDRVLVLVGGAFGQRWARLCARFGAEVIELPFAWGTAVNPDEVGRVVAANPGIKAIFATHNESSTGVVNDIEAVGAAVRKGDGGSPLLIVDAVSSLGGIDLRTDEWGIDIVVSASQKCLMLPPGLAMISVSERAKRVVESSRSSRFYLDLNTYYEFASKRETPFTPNVQLILALDEALAMIEAEGLPAAFRRHILMRDMVRAALLAVGLKPVVDDSVASPTVTAVWAPEGIDVANLRTTMRERFETELAGGQGELAGKVFRIGHMGYATPVDMLRTVASLELALKTLGFPLELGSGVRAAQEVLLNTVD